MGTERGIETWQARSFLPASEIGFTLARGELACVVGPRGCGKTSLLNLLAGLDDSGGTGADGGRGIRPPPYSLHIAYIHSPAIRTSAIGVADSGILVLPPLDGPQPLLRRMAKANGVERPPTGVMSRREALRAALQTEPDLLLIDEPRRDIDPSSARLFRDVLLTHWRSPQTTIVMVAGLDDALMIADRLLILSARPVRLLADLPVAVPRPRDGTEAILTDLREALVTEHPGLFPEEGHSL